MKFSTKPLSGIIILILLVGLPIEVKESIDKKLWKEALKIHHQAIVIDTHCDTPMVMIDRGLDIGKRSEKSKVDLIRMKEGGVDASFFAVFVSNRLDDKHPAKRALEMIDEIYKQVECYSQLARIAVSPQDIRDIHDSGKRAILIGMENGGPIEGSLRLLRNFYRLGVRYVTLTHSDNNDICDSSSAEKPKWNGLSEFGRAVVKEMNRLGMIIDVSHISDKAFWDVLEISRAPVMASHSCIRSLCDVERNMSDEMIKALARKGGVIQINFYSGFLDNEYSRKSKAVRKKLMPEMKVLIDVLIDHIDYAAKLVGVDYVGLGSDFDGAGSYPEGLEDISGFPLITYHLLKRGYKKKEIKKILGGNFLRVFDKVTRTAKRLREHDKKEDFSKIEKSF